jgi:hypothetical protein
LPDISFGPHGTVAFPTKYHGEVTLSHTKWDIICNQPERYYYRRTGEKVPTTLIAPDYVRHYKTITSQFIYYKKFESFRITDGIDGPLPCKYFAVVIDTARGRVCTVYPTDKPKTGSKEYKSPGA